jgi:hypothetical protein
LIKFWTTQLNRTADALQKKVKEDSKSIAIAGKKRKAQETEALQWPTKKRRKKTEITRIQHTVTVKRAVEYN